MNTFLFFALLGTCAASPQKIKLTEVQALTLKAGDLTAGRRVSPTQQLQCNGALCHHSPNTIRCINAGTDGSDAQWTCEAELPSDMKLVLNYVSCEGYDYPTDPYVLVGSCGLSYSIRSRFTKSGNRTDNSIFVAAVILIACLCTCRNTHHGPRDYGFVAGAATGAAATHWFGRRRRRRANHGFFRTSRRISRGYCRTHRR